MSGSISCEYYAVYISYMSHMAVLTADEPRERSAMLMCCYICHEPGACIFVRRQVQDSPLTAADW